MSVQYTIFTRCTFLTYFSGGPSRQTWIDLCQKASLDPLNLIVKHLGKLVDLIVSGTNADPKVTISPRLLLVYAELLIVQVQRGCLCRYDYPHLHRALVYNPRGYQTD